MKKYRRGYLGLSSAVSVVKTMTTILSVLLFVAGIIHSVVVVAVASSMKVGIFSMTFLPYIIYIIIIITIAYVINRILDHLMRMEVIALDGADVFEKEN